MRSIAQKINPDRKHYNRMKIEENLVQGSMDSPSSLVDIRLNKTEYKPLKVRFARHLSIF